MNTDVPMDRVMASVRSVHTGGLPTPRRSPEETLMTTNPLALLDELDEARAAATPGPWKVCEDHGRDVADEAWSWVAVTTEMGREVATTWPVGHEQHDPEADAALIVAEHNSLPLLTAALRAVAELHDGRRCADYTFESLRGYEPCPTVAAITAALTPEAADAGADL